MLLWRLGSNTFRIIGLTGRCKADFSKHIAPKFFHLSKLAATRSGSLDHIQHGASFEALSGLGRMKTVAGSHSNISGIRRHDKHFCTKRESRRPDCPEGGSSRIPRLTREAAAATGALRRTKSSHYADNQLKLPSRHNKEKQKSCRGLGIRDN